MAVSFANAIAAYARRAGASVAQEGLEPRSADPTKSFADVLADAAKSAVQTGHTGELVSAKAVAGQAELNDVVTAVSNAEITLQTVLAVRDKLVQSYQEILRMPI